MIYVTGDIHGDPSRIQYFCHKNNLTSDDVIVILGDVGANYYGEKRDRKMKKILSALSPIIFCVHGNHENRPQNVSTYTTKKWRGGTVLAEEEFPSLLFAVDGEIYDFDRKKAMVIGGAYSVDKFYRLLRGFAWWSDEQPTEETKTKVNALITENTHIDIVLSHTCPAKYTPTEMYLSMINQNTVDRSTEEWFDTIEEKLHYKSWYCGHWHTDKHIDKMHFLFESFETID